MVYAWVKVCLGGDLQEIIGRASVQTQAVAAAERHGSGIIEVYVCGGVVYKLG